MNDAVCKVMGGAIDSAMETAETLRMLTTVLAVLVGATSVTVAVLAVALWRTRQAQVGHTPVVYPNTRVSEEN